jgi:hypothetical protein
VYNINKGVQTEDSSRSRMQKGIIRNKKAKMAWQTLFAIILMIIIFYYPVQGAVKYVLGGPTAVEKSVSRLQATINEVANSPDKDVVLPSSIKMSSEQAIIGFTKSASEVRYNVKLHLDYSFERPTSCGADKACLCYCEKGFKEKFTSQMGKPVGLRCDEDKLVCEPVEAVDFPAFTEGEAFGGSSASLRHNYKFEGGFILQRNSDVSMEKTGDWPIAYVKKLESNIVAVCTVREECFP